MSLAPEDYGNPSLEGLKDEDLQVLEDWFNKFKAKYPVRRNTPTRGAAQQSSIRPLTL